MNENTSVQDGAETTATDEFIDDGWGDEGIDLSDVADEPEAEETPSETEAENQEEKTEEKPGEVEADHSLTLNYMGENKVVSREEAVILAQKGLDYDRQKTRAEEALAEKAKLDKTLAAVAEMAKAQNMTPDELLENVQVSVLAQKEGLSPEDAKRRVAFERRERELAEREAALNTQKTQDDAAAKEVARREADIRNFAEAYPGVEPKSIPKEVWQAVAKGSTLTEAYARHEAAQLKLALEAEKKNRENAQKSAGSRTSDGRDDKKNLIDKYWDDED